MPVQRRVFLLNLTLVLAIIGGVACVLVAMRGYFAGASKNENLQAASAPVAEHRDLPAPQAAGHATPNLNANPPTKSPKSSKIEAGIVDYRNPNASESAKSSEKAEGSVEHRDSKAMTEAGTVNLTPRRPEELVSGARLRFRNHIKERSKAGMKAKVDDEPVQSSIADLKAASTIDAYIEMSAIYIMTKEFDRAEKVLLEAQTKFRSPRITSELERLNFIRSSDADTGTKNSSSLFVSMNSILLSCMLSLQVQDPAEEGSPPESNASGELFVKAHQAFKKGDIKAALENLAEARRVHERDAEGHPEWDGMNSKYENEGGGKLFVAMCNYIDSYWNAYQKLKSFDYKGDITQIVSSVEQVTENMKKVTELLANAKYLEAGDTSQVQAGVAEAIQIAQMKDPEGVIRDLRRKHAALKRDTEREIKAAKARADAMVQAMKIELHKLKNHPAILQDARERNSKIDPVATYYNGVNCYYNGDYQNAELLFCASLSAKHRNAVAHHFLGLARLAQGNVPSAYQSFAEGARIEQLGYSDSEGINVALERVQGPNRILLESFRTNARQLYYPDRPGGR